MFRFAPARALLLGLLAAVAGPAGVRAADGVVDVRLLAINDFHGNLKPPVGGLELRDPADPEKRQRIAAGGVEAMATLIAREKAAQHNAIFVAAGDLVGASPLLSALFGDEPTIESLSLMGLELTAVGNHEFDKGVAELLRKQNGGCNSDKSCLALHPFLGAKFQYLAASVIDTATNQPILPPSAIRTFDGVPIGFVGLPLKGTPAMVKPSGIAGLEFRDEAETINAAVADLKAQGVETVVVLIHEGGFPTGDYDDCPGISGPIVDIVKKLDPAVRVVVSGHTHKAYLCRIDDRLVTSGDKYGTIVTEIDLKLDAATKKLIEAKAANLIVRTAELAKDPDQSALIAAYERVAAPMMNRPVGRITATMERIEIPTADTALGNLVADAMLAAARTGDKGGAEIAFTNPGGIRMTLAKTNDEGTVTYGDLFATLPFGNSLVTTTLTGAEIYAILERQWAGQSKPKVLQVSAGFGYAWRETAAPGARVDPASIKLNGEVIDPARSYRVVINDFLADGGDGFVQFKAGRDPVSGDTLLDAMEAHVAGPNPVAPPATGRIVKLD